MTRSLAQRLSGGCSSESVYVDRFDLQGTPGNAREKVGCFGHFSRPVRPERETGMVIVAMRGGFIV